MSIFVVQNTEQTFLYTPKDCFLEFNPLVPKLSFAQNVAVFLSWGHPTWLPWQQYVYRKHNSIQCHFTFTTTKI
jgi:hypothetical protein